MTLDSPDVHVWPVKLMASERGATVFERLLSPEEAERHRRLRDARTSRCYALSHGVLRTLLGRYLGMAPQQIAYREGRSGKPALAMDGAPLAFNMSHAGDMAVYAFARDCQVGIDVELVRPMPDLQSVAARFFSPVEYS